MWNLDSLKTIYGINKGNQKVRSTRFPFREVSFMTDSSRIVSLYLQTDFYRVQEQLANGQPTPTFFTSTDEDFHAANERPVSAAYSMSTMTKFEPFVDRTIWTLFKGLLSLWCRRKCVILPPGCSIVAFIGTVYLEKKWTRLFWIDG